MTQPDASNRYPVAGAGLGLRRSMLDTLAHDVPSQIDFFEVAPENWMGVGGKFGRAFRALTERHDFVTHGLSLSLGAPAPLDEDFLRKLKVFLDEHGILFYTEHLSYCGDDGHLYDLLPIPFTDDAFGHVAHGIVGERNGQQIVEMP
ncbi:MAG: DUF692 family multinuclear iron-containing protein, partial [Pseudomonadota bacterium]